MVAHNEVSKLLAHQSLLHHWSGYIVEDMLPAGTRTIDALMKWPGSEEPRHTGFALASGVDGSLFDALGKDPERTNRFGAAMQVLQNTPGLDPSALLDIIGWKEDCSHLIVDVGGSYGSIACMLLERYPGTKAVVQDKPEVITKARVPPELEGRLTFHAHDFFAEQPVKGAEVYFFRSVLHDWPDAYALKILRNLIPALKLGAKVVLNETCLPPPGVLPHTQEQLARYGSSAGRLDASLS